MREPTFACWLPGASRGTIAALLLAAPAAAAAQGFAAGAAVVHGTAIFSVGTGPQIIAIPASSPVTTINWTPTDTATGGGAIDFLPAGNAVNYVGGTGTSVPYTVLNRIIASDPTRTIAFNGAVTSDANIRVWFYSPGGMLIGASARFDVGGLVLTTADPVTDSNGNFMPSFDRFSVQGTAGSTSAITIQPGASIKALNGSQSNYIVAIAPQISQGGDIAVAGSVALVAAESATFAVDSRGLFNIAVTSGTTVAANTFTHSGSTGGPNAAPTGGFQRVYMVAVPKNNAIAMAIASGGSIGFAVADAANLDGNQIVLSAGDNIADTGSGNPIVAGPAGLGIASLNVGAGAYTSETFAAATDLVTVGDAAANITFNSNLAVIAPRATVNAAVGTISVAGDLIVDADNSIDGAAKTALVAVAPGTSLTVGGNAAALGVNGDLIVTAGDMLTGSGGSAMLLNNAGSITVQGNATVSADSAWGPAALSSSGSSTSGGTAQIVVNGGSLAVGGALTASAVADSSGAYAAFASQTPRQGIDAIGGSASITASGALASINAGNGITASANAVGGYDMFGYGGNTHAGQALIQADSGGAIAAGQGGSIAALANAAAASPAPQSANGTGGTAIGGTAQLIADAGTMTVAGANGIAAVANATGGNVPAYAGSGGNATGGTALIATRGTAARIATNTSGSTGGADSFTRIEANAQGGQAAGSFGAGGFAKGGTAALTTTGPGQSIAIDRAPLVSISAQALAGGGAGQGGGNAVGGSAQLLANAGSIAITNTSLAMDAGAAGGSDNSGNGGNAVGGIVRLAAMTGGTANVDVSSSLSAFGSGGGGSGAGGNALGGKIYIELGDNAVSFAGAATTISLDASVSAGSGIVPGTALPGGVRLRDLGALTLAGAVNLTANTQLYGESRGSIDVAGSIGGSGTGAYLHLLSDSLGTGTGTVTLGTTALNFPGNQIDIYYNPAMLGTPTDFTAGIMAGNATAYQLVDTLDQLQRVGSFLTQNFALGRNIDASPTQGWNGGAGFVPIGNYANGTAFRGDFDGLDHTITNLTINNGNGDSGLFGSVGGGTGAQIIIRNIGLVDPQVTGSSFVGALIGGVGHYMPAVADTISITNSYTTGGAVSGIDNVGGLVGIVNYGVNTLTDVHSDTAVTGTGSDVGGLVGFASGATITRAFATGTVTALANGAIAVGGLIGQMTGSGTLSQAYATGAVTTGAGSNGVGGLVGGQGGTITNAYATGSVSAGAGSDSVGGLVGQASVTVSDSWASGNVSAPTSTNVGGFAGKVDANASVTNAYWDSFSTGQAAGFGTNSGTVANLNPVTSDPAQASSPNYAFYRSSYSNLPSTDWVYDNGITRPVGAWEVPVARFDVADIASAHQIQLVDFNMAGNYAIVQNIDMRGTGGTSDIWGPGGFMPLGGVITDPPLTGTLAGDFHVLSNLTMSTGFGFVNSGLVQQNYGTISDLGLANVAITAGQSSAVGALAGVNAGRITDSFATGTIVLTQTSAQTGVAGGLVGINADGSTGGTAGSITQSYASVALSGGAVTGGLAGDNEGAIDTSYANGSVSGTLTGGLVGRTLDVSGPTVTNSYWDTQLSGQNVGCGSVSYSGACSGATGLTTAQTLQPASFAGFVIDTQGGQGLPWRQYVGSTTPLLAGFLTPITVQPGSATQQYDAQLPAVGVTTYGADPALTFGTAQLAGLTQNAGTTNVTYIGGLYSNQLGYDFVPSTAPGIVTITQAPLLLSAASDTKVYDATTNSMGMVAVSGLYGNDSVGNATQSFTSPNVMGSDGSTLIVNPGYSVNDGAGGNNYTVSLQSAAGTITPAPLAVTYTAFAGTGIYGQTVASPSGVVNAQGLQGDDSLASVSTGTASFTTSANARSPVGAYAIIGAGLSGASANYSFSFAQDPGNATALTITPAGLQVAADPQSRSYGAANPALTYRETGLVNGDMLSGSLATAATTASNVGNYAITQGSLAASSNYTLSYTGANLTVDPASLTVTYTANAARSIYGTVPTGLSGSESASGLVNGDTLAGAASYATAATAQSPKGSYAIIGSGLTGSTANYSVSFAQAPGNATALTIDPASLLVAADPQSRSYGAANPALTYRQTGLVNGDMLSGSLATAATTASNVGSYAITQGSLAASSNYTLSYTGANLTVDPASLTITYIANPARSIYGAIPTGLSGSESASGLVNGDTLAGVTTGAASYATAATAQSATGSYAITGSGLTGSTNNYSVSFAQAPGNATALTIDPASLMVAADPQSRSYGAANPALTYRETGLVNGDMLSGSLATAATAASNVGNYAITQGSLAASSNYTLSYTGANLTVDPASLTVTYTANPARSIYGTVPAGLSGSESSSGLVNGDTLASVTSGAASYATAATAQSSIGSYAITGSGLTGSSNNYSFSFAQAPGNATALTIDPASLMVAADPQSRSYGNANPALTYRETGLVNGDMLSGSLATGATAASNVGSYAITQGSLAASSNYVLSYTGANLTINPASLTITYTANVARSIYGTVPTGLSGSQSASGLVNGDTLAGVTSGAASYATAATAQSSKGSYAIIGSGLTGSSNNYSFSFAQAPGNATALTIDPASLLVAADPQSRSYGAANPALTYRETGLVNGDMLSGSLATAATAASNVGNYAITQGSLAANSNYTLSYTGANLSVDPASLTVTYTANAARSIYGTVPTGLSGSQSASGLVNGDTLAGVTSGVASYATAATTQSSKGSYAIIGSGLTGSSNNYSFSFAQAPGNATALTIDPASLSIAADPQSRSYGTANAALTYRETGLVDGDALSGSLTTGATAASNVGNYAITQGSLAASSNYTLSYTGANLTVDPASLTVTYTADPARSTYGFLPSGLTGSVALAGLVNGDTADAVTNGSALWTSQASAASHVGAYAITGSGVGLSSANYALTSLQAAGNAAALTVDPAALTVLYTATPASRIYGADNPALSGTATALGLVNGDTLVSVTSGTASFATAASGQSPVGTYAVTGSGLSGSSADYQVGFAQAPGNATALAIAARPITVTADPQQRDVGAPDPTFSYVVTGPSPADAQGLVNGDRLTGQLASTSTSTAPVGNYDIVQGTLAASPNYRLAYVGNILTIVPGTSPVAAISNDVEANLPDQTESPEEKRRKQEAAVLAALSGDLGVSPPQIALSLIDERLVTIAPPVTDAVTSNGNASLWAPKAP